MNATTALDVKDIAQITNMRIVNPTVRCLNRLEILSIHQVVAFRIWISIVLVRDLTSINSSSYMIIFGRLASILF